MLREISAYEVRCPRCDVSFPVGTRKCMHCNGPTGAHGRVQLLETMTREEHPTNLGTSDTSATATADQFERPDAFVDMTESEPETFDRPTSIGRSLFRSFGGLIWVVVLIAFSLARNCSSE
jgi:hypothetical protein